MTMRAGRHLFLAVALGFGVASPSTPVSAEDRAHLEAVSVHLLLQSSGALSEDISKIADFHSWNGEPSGTGIPEKETFESAVIKLRFHADREIFAKGTQATVTIRNEEGGRRVRTENIRDVYIPPEGVTYKFIVLKEVGCKPMLVSVTGDAKPVRIMLPFRCGE
jgi:hypothetical protein